MEKTDERGIAMRYLHLKATVPRRYVKVRGKVVEVAAGETLIGRGDDCAIQLFNSLVSRHHARMKCQESDVTIEDLGSRNGTKVNSKYVEGARVLQDGDVIQIGPYDLFFIEAEAPPSASQPRERRRVPTEDNDPDRWASITEVAWIGPSDNTSTTGRWPLEMLIELLGRAILAERDRDVAGIMKQAMAAVDAAFDGGNPIERPQLDPLWEAAIWLTKRQRNPTWYWWAQNAYRRAGLNEPPTPTGMPLGV